MSQMRRVLEVIESSRTRVCMCTYVESSGHDVGGLFSGDCFKGKGEDLKGNETECCHNLLNSLLRTFS